MRVPGQGAGYDDTPPYEPTPHRPPPLAVAGPTEALTAVVKLDPSRAPRSTNMMRYANAALDLIAHLQTKR